MLLWYSKTVNGDQRWVNGLLFDTEIVEWLESRSIYNKPFNEELEFEFKLTFGIDTYESIKLSN